MLGLIAENLHVETPPYFPWAGLYETRDEWLAKCVPWLGTVYDFPSLTVEQMIADGDKVVALVRQGILESEDEAVHIESWKVKDGKPSSSPCSVSTRDRFTKGLRRSAPKRDRVLWAGLKRRPCPLIFDPDTALTGRIDA